ncbi:helix-turn-helix domain-containing protein [Candidatus Enterococcus moelleringii]|uniref:helix-turn-helix domain-containing protein n=1 Tax=Candidatus Enterococcus moelleringii TaxID=2815325 RepID=UPI001F6226E0|nr:AraC family transcriptional regulator [Enterococcus sp. 669A]
MATDIQRFTATLAYIEEHLFEEIDLKQLAKQALLSEYTYHRFFTYLTGHSFTNYIRNRRLSEAVYCLRKKEQTIEELADLCGYANRSAFHRAFVNFHGLTPAQAKDEQASINFFPPIRLNIEIAGGETLNYRIEQLPAFQITGKMNSYLLDDQLFTHTGKQWENFSWTVNYESLPNQQLPISTFSE